MVLRYVYSLRPSLSSTNVFRESPGQENEAESFILFLQRLDFAHGSIILYEGNFFRVPHSADLRARFSRKHLASSMLSFFAHRVLDLQG